MLQRLLIHYWSSAGSFCCKYSSIVSMRVSYVEVMIVFRFPESTEHKFHTINAVTEQVNALCADYPVYR
ncbi:hypothetical protein [Marinomonas communis]|uniref:hypothetical protein n=1 Tax=Marinomonas communis TaxID=28254 RepID=UPI00105D5537|nr:hypothetical protein [Marinomonas communis]